MSFEDMPMKDLFKVAKEWGVDSVKPGMKKDAVIAEIEAEGVTFGAVEAFGLNPTGTPIVYKEEPVDSNRETCLVKMVRENPYFEFGRYVFEKRKPFVIMDVKDANRLFEIHSGFNIASPADARDFYG